MSRINHSAKHMRGVWIKPDVYPLIGAVVVGCGFMVYKGVEHMFAPDVHFNPKRRSAEAWEGKYRADEGEKWADHMATFYRHKDDDLSKLGIFEALSPSWWKRRAEVASNPHAHTRHGDARMD